MPLITPLLIAGAKTGAGAAAVDWGKGLATNWFGGAARDASREQRAAALTTAALNGDPRALRQLTFDAFEKRTGQPGDDREAYGSASPPDSRNLAKKGLQQYVIKFGGLPPELGQYAARLGAPIVERQPSIAQQILTPAINAVTDQAIDRVEYRAAERAQVVAPYLIVGGVVALVALYLIVKK